MPKHAGKPTDFESFLTWEALTDVLSYDPISGVFRWRENARAGLVGHIAGHVNQRHGYRTIVIDGHTYLASRLAWLHETKEWPSGYVDHRNGDRADNHWNNLRDTTPSENALNKGLRGGNLTGVAGVHWETRLERYVARLAIGGKRINLGAFDTLAEAATARYYAEMDHYGEFRRQASSVSPVETGRPKVRLAKNPAQRGIPADVSSGLNHAMLIRALSYDPATGEFRWLETINGETAIGPVAGKTNKKGYRVIGLGGRTFYAHRLAWLYMKGHWPEALVDHKDGNPSNNAWSNLRAATRAQNNSNRIATPGKSGITGVYWNERLGKWEARASKDNKMVYLGIFDTIEEAQAAREKFEVEHRGEYLTRRA